MRRDVVVSMVREAEEPGGPNRFAMSLQSWTSMIELGTKFGWQPAGTTYVPAATAKTEATAVHNYEPGDARDYKRISSQDAGNWARALESAKDSPQLAALIAVDASETTIVPLQAVMVEFIEYAYGGAFAFAGLLDAGVGEAEFAVRKEVSGV